jgi:hypothetical protein
MDVRLVSCEVGMVAIGPAAAVASLWIKRWWKLALVLTVAAVLGWVLLQLWGFLEDAAITEEFARIPSPTREQIEGFNADGASKAFAFLFGIPLFLIYGLICVGLVHAGRAAMRWFVHA